MMESSSASVWVGIDVSKQHLDVALLRAGHPLTARFANQPAAFASLLAWLHTMAQAPVHVCLEATGTYHDAVVAFLLTQGVRLSVLPSVRLKAFRQSEGWRNKTDQLDAILLARYGQQKQPAAFVAVPEELAHLRLLLSRLRDLADLHRQESNRLENGRWDACIQAHLREHRRLLEGWQQEVLSQIRAWIKEHAELEQAVELLVSIPGIGERTAWHLLAILGADGSRFGSAHQLVVYVGLEVAREDSGKQIKAGHISKQGPSHVRACLGMAAIVAKRWDADMRAWASELTARGKKSRQVRVALMRKLLHLAYGVLKHQQPYDPTRAWPTHARVTGEVSQAA